MSSPFGAENSITIPGSAPIRVPDLFDAVSSIQSNRFCCIRYNLWIHCNGTNRCGEGCTHTHTMLVKMHPNAAMHSRYHHNRPYLPLYGDLFTVAVLITYLIAGKTHRIDAFAASEQLLRIGCEATSIKYKSSQFTFLTFNAHREIPFYLHFFYFFFTPLFFPSYVIAFSEQQKNRHIHTHSLEVIGG